MASVYASAAAANFPFWKNNLPCSFGGKADIFLEAASK
jgi:hypothetical protein